MFCIHCGATLKPGTKFCIECGGASPNSSTEPDAPAGQAAPIASAPAMPVSAAAEQVSGEPKAMPAATANRTGLIAAAAVLGVAVLAGVGFGLSKIQSGGNPLSTLLGNLQPEKLPQTYGLFVWNGSDWVELGKDKTSIEIDIAEAPKFLMHGKAIEKMTQSFTLRRMHFMRNSIAQDRDGGKKAIEKVMRTWGLKENAEPIEGRFAPVKGNPEMVMWIPAAKLGPGAYQPALSRQNQDAFFVNKNSFMGELARSEHCIDRILTRKFMWDNPIPAKYAACAANVGQSGSSDSTSSKTLDPQWFGKWVSEDGKRTLEVSASKIGVSDLDVKGKPPSRFDLRWVNGPNIGEEQFGYLAKGTSQAEASSRYEEALRQFKKDPMDFGVSDADPSRRAIAAMTPGGYRVVQGYAGGDCGIWEWILDDTKMLEISQCKYGFHVRLLKKAS